ncbi:hypothetical protein TNCV_1689131 [Trichonephila clavipes]|nr:hypothetical protein TNCV_1689131 [Trichonephila clavipes]
MYLQKTPVEMKFLEGGLCKFEYIRGALSSCSAIERKLYVTVDPTILGGAETPKLSIGETDNIRVPLQSQAWGLQAGSYKGLHTWYHSGFGSPRVLVPPLCRDLPLHIWTLVHHAAIVFLKLFSRHSPRRQTSPVNCHPVGALLCLFRLSVILSWQTRGQTIDNDLKATCIVSEPPALIYKTGQEWKGVGCTKRSRHSMKKRTS